MSRLPRRALGFTVVMVQFHFFQSGSRGAHSRLDRFLIKDGQARWLEGVSQYVVFKFSSDHLPIVLTLEVILGGPRPFHFFNNWCSFWEHRTVVKKEWEDNMDLSLSFWGCLKSIKRAIQKQGGVQFSLSMRQIQKCEATLKELLIGLVLLDQENMVDLQEKR